MNICANVVNLTIPLLAGFIIDAVGGTRGYMAVFGLSFAVSAVTCAPVSYTHLDVYKRQALSMLNTGALEELLPLCEKEGVGVVPYQMCIRDRLFTGVRENGFQID